MAIGAPSRSPYRYSPFDTVFACVRLLPFLRSRGRCRGHCASVSSRSKGQRRQPSSAALGAGLAGRRWLRRGARAMGVVAELLLPACTMAAPLLLVRLDWLRRASARRDFDFFSLSGLSSLRQDNQRFASRGLRSQVCAVRTAPHPRRGDWAPTNHNCWGDGEGGWQ